MLVHKKPPPSAIPPPTPGQRQAHWLSVNGISTPLISPSVIRGWQCAHNPHDHLGSNSRAGFYVHAHVWRVLQG